MAAIVQIFISAGHNYFGHHGRAAGAHGIVERDAVECVAGCGLVGDRFFSHKENYRGQITFFAAEIHDEIRRTLGEAGRPVSVFRRNVVTRGLDLNELIGRQFLLDGVLFEGTEECRPCAWMDEAFAPGAEQWLRGRGGLRARILTNGILRCNADVAWEVLDAIHA